FLKKLIVLNIELQYKSEKHKTRFFYNVDLVSDYKDIIRFRSEDATFSSFLKTCRELNIFIK
ncbi:hypothetical protein DZC11_11145, partial [Salmonella enterica]|nr:hypothetical protein [Salmonella enterica]